MALSVAVGSFNIGTGAAASTVTITPGFTTKALILWWNGRTTSTDASGAATYIRGMGFAVSSSSFAAWCGHDVDAVGTSDTDCAYRADACILEISNAALVGWADVQSINSTEVIFEILDQFTTDLRIFYLALGGDDITGAEVGSFTPTGVAPVNQVVNTTNQGKVIFFGGAKATAADTLTARSYTMFGAASTSSDEHVWTGGGQDAATSGATATYCRAGDCIGVIRDDSQAVQNRAEFVSFNGTPSFTINWLERQEAPVMFYLLLAGDFQVAIGNFVMLTTTGTITESGLAFQPTAALLVSACKVEDASDTRSAHDELCIGAATSSTNELNMQSSSRSGNTNMTVATAIDYDSIYTNLAVATGNVEGQADFTGFTSDGFTLNMSDADPVASFAWYVAFASEAAAATGWGPLLGLYNNRLVVTH